VRVHKRNGERGIAIYVSAVILVMAVPMIGLVVDATTLYIIKCRLQGAVDGAALAAARALARGTTSADQISAAKADASAYVKINYPDAFFFSQNVSIDTSTDVTVDLSVANQRKVSVTAHVTMPALLMRYLSFDSTTINATAQTVRRDVNIVLVVDRSNSLNLTNSCEPLKQAAKNFVNKFADGRDFVGLVTFASSTNADFPIASNFKSAGTSVLTMLGNITCAGSTSSAMGLWQGYDQLVGLNQAGALNIILFFTDGKPTGVAVDMPLAGSSPCLGGTSHGAGNPKTIRGLYNTFTNVDQYFGILNHVNGGSVTNSDLNPTPDATTGYQCTYMLNWLYDGGFHNMTATSDFLGIPTTDIFGNNLNNGYQSVTLSSGYIDINNASNASAMAYNAADSAAARIRAGANDPVYNRGLTGILVYSIGLMNTSYPASPGFLERVANDPRSDIYDGTKPVGLFVAAPTSADIDTAYQAIASEILRLAK
jgi:Flp pilus assembly protein TadG